MVDMVDIYLEFMFLLAMSMLVILLGIFIACYLGGKKEMSKQKSELDLPLRVGE